VQTYDGEICALRLSPEFDQATGDPVLLFKASDAPWVGMAGFGKLRGQVTDGPFLHRLGNGQLIMLWSSFGGKTSFGGKKLIPEYALGVARSESGTIKGPWKQDPEPLFSNDGGHGMFFRTLDNVLVLSLHQPNGGAKERPRLFKVDEKDGKLSLTPYAE
jgi:hypothetical protein